MRQLLFLLAVSVAATAAAASVSLPPLRQQQLRNLVIQDCGSCHGLTFKGGLGKPLLPANLEGIPEEAIAEVILDGVSGTPMPPWRGMLDEADARWIAAELKKGMAP